MAGEDATRSGKITDDDLKGLSAEERAALEDETDESETLRAVADEGDAEGEGEDSAAEGEGEGEGEGEAEGAAAAEGEGEATLEQTAAEAEPAGPEDDDLAVNQTMRRTIPDVSDVEGKLATLKEELDAAAAAFKDGGEWEEFAREEQRINAERANLHKRQASYEEAVAYNADAETHDWLATVNVFKRQAAKAGVDYDKQTVKGPDGKDVPLIDELDAMVKFLASDQRNANRSPAWCLREADRIVRARFGLTAAPAAEKPGAGAKPPERRPNLKGIPRTLAHAPVAQENDPGGADGEFAAIDNLEGLELEAAIARMTPAQQQRYAEAG